MVKAQADAIPTFQSRSQSIDIITRADNSEKVEVNLMLSRIDDLKSPIRWKRFFPLRDSHLSSSKKQHKAGKNLDKPLWVSIAKVVTVCGNPTQTGMSSDP